MLLVSITSFGKAFNSVLENRLYGAALGRWLILFCACIERLPLLLFTLILSRLVHFSLLCLEFLLLLVLLIFPLAIL